MGALSDPKTLLNLIQASKHISYSVLPADVTRAILILQYLRNGLNGVYKLSDESTAHIPSIRRNINNLAKYDYTYYQNGSNKNITMKISIINPSDYDFQSYSGKFQVGIEFVISDAQIVYNFIGDTSSLLIAFKTLMDLIVKIERTSNGDITCTIHKIDLSEAIFTGDLHKIKYEGKPVLLP